MDKLLSTSIVVADDLDLSKLESESLLSQTNAIMKLKRYKQMQTNKKESEAIVRESTALNSWVRQQGNPNTTVFGTGRRASESKNTNDRLRLPKLFESTSSDSLKVGQLTKKKRTTEPTPSLAAINQPPAPPPHRGFCKTPNPCNHFYSNCIDAVQKCNEPRKMKLLMPRELKYVQNIPFLKYTAFGCGKSIDCVWQIETRPSANVNLI